jgi:hypothetical protein
MPVTSLDARPTPARVDLPDLVTVTRALLSPTKWSLRPNEQGQYVLRFNYTIANRGPGHFLLAGKRNGPDELEVTGKQLSFSNGQPVVVRENSLVLSRLYGRTGPTDPEHNHWHMRDTLRVELTKEGRPDFHVDVTKSHGAVVAGSVLAPDQIRPVDPSTPNIEASPLLSFEGDEYLFGSNSDNSLLAFGQRILSGRGDSYGFTANPALPLPTDESPEGWYRFKVTLDPNDLVAEYDETNNVEEVRLRVGQGPGDPPGTYRVVEIQQVTVNETEERAAATAEEVRTMDEAALRAFVKDQWQGFDSVGPSHDSNGEVLRTELEEMVAGAGEAAEHLSMHYFGEGLASMQVAAERLLTEGFFERWASVEGTLSPSDVG